METTNNNIKIVRLQSGEDIIASYTEDEKGDVVMLDNPMHIIFKRMANTGRTVMMMMPWLPIEIIKENSAMLYTSDILTIIEPKDDLVEYYGSMVTEAQLELTDDIKLREGLFGGDEEEDDDEYYDDEQPEVTAEDLVEALKQKVKGSLH